MTTPKKKVDWRIACTALICIAGLEVYALSKGINGVLLTAVIGIMAGIAGLMIPTPNILKGGEKNG